MSLTLWWKEKHWSFCLYNNKKNTVCSFMLIDPNRSHLHRLFSEWLNSSFFFLSHMFFSFSFCALTTNSVRISIFSCEAVSAGRWSSAWKPCTRQTHTVCYQREQTEKTHTKWRTLPTKKKMVSPAETEWGPLWVSAGRFDPLSSSARALQAAVARADSRSSPLRLSLLLQLSLSSRSTSSPQSGRINVYVLHTVAQSRHTLPMQHPWRKTQTIFPCHDFTVPPIILQNKVTGLFQTYFLTFFKATF